MTAEANVLQIGLVMPIASIEDCGAEHWLDVQAIIKDAVSNIPGFDAIRVNLVSESNSSGLIHKRIVQGLYSSHVVICDVSCKNPNVMFELGMRLAFDKPTIIIKDNKTSYTFDAGGIEHIEYPRDLRFQKIVEFKETLSIKVLATYRDWRADPNHSPFLKSFGSFKVATIEQTEVTVDKLMLDMMTELQADISSIKRIVTPNNSNAVKKNIYGISTQTEKLIEKLTIEFLQQNNLNNIGDNSEQQKELAQFMLEKEPERMKHLSVNAVMDIAKRTRSDQMGIF